MSKKKHRNALITDAPGVLVLGDKTYLVSAPSKSDQTLLTKWIIQNHKPKEGLGFTSADLDGLSPADRLLFIQEAARDKKKPTGPSQEEMFLLLNSPAGMAFMIWVAARKYDKSVSLKEFQDAITADNVDEVALAFDDACGVMEVDEGGNETGEIDPKAHGPTSSSPTPMG